MIIKKKYIVLIGDAEPVVSVTIHIEAFFFFFKSILARFFSIVFKVTWDLSNINILIKRKLCCENSAASMCLVSSLYLLILQNMEIYNIKENLNRSILTEWK